MDKNTLIDFENSIDNYCKISSPLIPVPTTRSSGPRLSDIENNPFDKVLRTIANKDDPFECNTNILPNNNFKNTTANKENIGHLISPIQTPVKSKKHIKLSTNPLYISAEEVKDMSINLSSISETQNLSICNTSLQILSDSVINADGDLICACDLPLPDSLDDSSCSNKTNNKLHMQIPSVIIEDENKELLFTSKYTTCSSLNNAFIDSLSSEHLRNRTSTRSSIDSKESLNSNSFNVKSLGISDISNVLPSVSSVTSKDIESYNQLDKAFLKDSSEVKIAEPRRCLSARKPNNFISVSSTSKPTNLNNSFAGFNYNDRNFKFSLSDISDGDSVFLEATQLADFFRTSGVLSDLKNKDISVCSPPWEEEEVVFVDVDEDKSNKNHDKTKQIQSDVIENNNIEDKIPVVQHELDNDVRDKKCNDIVTKSVLQVDSNNKIAENLKYKDNVTKSKKEIEKESFHEQEKLTVVQNKETNTVDNTATEMAKDLYHNLKDILNSTENEVDKKELGENLLKNFAIFFNIESSAARSITEENKPINKLQRSKSDSKVSEKIRAPLLKQENKLAVPKLKTQPVAPGKLDKNLKVRNEKEKVTSKGPLKAMIPLTNMAKNKKSITSKVSLLNTTPPRQQPHSLLQIKKTSTPNEPKIKPPMAQSTPEVYSKQGTDLNTGTPITKRHFGFSVSPLARPQSTSDISNMCLNNSLSPKNTSGSAPNLNKSGSNLSKNLSNSSIPTMKSLSRRNSASDMSTSRSTALNRSYENKPACPPVPLKRSSSFQYKSASAATSQKTNNKLDNNNTVKTYGIPGKLKSLRLVSKARNSVAD